MIAAQQISKRRSLGRTNKPEKIETRNDRKKADAKSERELTRHLTKINNAQRAELKSRRTAPLTSEKPATASQREKITKLAEDLGLTYAALHTRLHRAKSYQAAKAMINRMNTAIAKRDAKVSQLPYRHPDEHEWFTEADPETDLTPEEVKDLDRQIERVKWISTGVLAGLLIFMAGWFARGL